MSITQFELGRYDKNLLEYMLDRCIVAKMIEQTGNTVPYDYSFCYGGRCEGDESSIFFNTLQDFLLLARIGKLEHRELTRSGYWETFSIRLYSLEELAYFKLSAEQLKKKESMISNIKNCVDSMDYCNFDGDFNVVGTRIFMRVEYVNGFAYELCDILLALHQQADRMIRSLRTNPKERI